MNLEILHAQRATDAIRDSSLGPVLRQPVSCGCAGPWLGLKVRPLEPGFRYRPDATTAPRHRLSLAPSPAGQPFRL